jgi:beta-xylosidase
MNNSDRRVAELLSRMTLEEKVAQLTSLIPTTLYGPDGIRPEVAATKMAHGVGYFQPHSGGFPRTAADLARLNNEAQRYLVEHTRLGIPAIMHVEALNGINGPTFTQFPTPIALAATWDPASVGEMAELTRRQMRAVGLHHALSPVLDVARDARWGRVHETYGEEPYLVAAFGVSFVRELQGDSPEDGVIATGKHFLGYAMSEGGLNMSASPIARRELLEVHARPFAAAIQLAGLRSVMNSLSEWDGVPAAADPRLFRDLLRGELGFTGTVVSDWGSVANLVTHHRVARDEAEAAILALRAGIDVELPAPFAFGEPLIAAVQNGRLDLSVIDEAVTRVLSDKFALGLFERPYVDEDPIRIAEVAEAGADLSRRLARESVTLVKNRGKILPLTRQGLRVAVIGPHARLLGASFAPYMNPAFVELTRAMLAGRLGSMVGGEDAREWGPDFGHLQREVGSILAMEPEQYAREFYGTVSLGEAIAEVMPHARVTVVEGSGLIEDTGGVADAVAAAGDADVIILALGGRARWFFGERTEGEGADASDIGLPAAQKALVDAVAAVGKPMVGVLFSGRPLALEDVDDRFDAILFGYYGAQFGTRAVAEVLAGVVNPRGRLPYSIPRRTGQVPIHVGQRFGTGYRRAEGDHHGHYVDSSATPLYAFGHGLSYSHFEYSDLTVSATSVVADGVVAVAVTVRNAGDRSGTEVAQLYVQDEATGVTRPALQLAGFHGVDLEPGEEARIEFDLELPILAYLGRDGGWIVEPGPITIAVGPASDDLPLRQTIEIVGEVTDVTRRRVYLTTSRRLTKAAG